MNKNEFEAKLEKFDLLAESTQARLTGIMALLTDKRVPSKEEITALDDEFEDLRTNYEDAVELAKSRILGEELPPEGSGLKDYATAIETSSLMMIKKQIEKAGLILGRFTRIRAKLSEYALALKPYQDAAADLLKELSEETVEEIASTTVAQEALLGAIDAENIHSPEGFALLEEVNKHYPMQIQWGLVGHQYYVETAEEKHISDGSDTFAQEDPCSSEAVMNNETTVQVEASDRIAEPADISADINQPEIEAREAEVSLLDEGSQSSSTEVTSVESPVVQETVPNEITSEFISPVNKIKTGNPSASSFRKEVIKIGRINTEIKIVLPLLTNVGVLTKKQAYLFAVCMECFEETDKNRNAIEISIDALVQKGYLACYRIGSNGFDEDVYCLSGYCYKCLRKDSISVQMKGFWGLSFGKYKYLAEDTMTVSRLQNAVKKNSDLIQYLYSEKDALSEEEYQTIKQSIRFEDEYYYVAVIAQNGKDLKCVILSDEVQLAETKETAVLYCSEEDVLPEAISESIHTLFLLYQGSCTRYERLEETMQLFQDESSDEIVEVVEDIIGTDNKNEEENDIVFDEDNDVVEQDSEPVSSPSETEREEKSGAVESAVIITDEIEESTHESDPAVMLQMKGAPSDQDFCALITKILNCSVSTRDQLTSAIVQAVLLANGAALEKNRPQAHRLADQLKLATHLLLGDAPYSSEHLTAVFTNPEDDNKALLLSAYLFAMLNPSVSYDYGLRNQTEMFFTQYERYFDRFGAFKPLFNKLISVQSIATTGFSPATIALLGSAAESDAFIDGLRKDANNYLVVQSPKTRMKALPLLYNNCFGSGSDLYECMRIIAEDKTDQDSIEYVEAILSEYCNRQNDAFTLNNGKVEERLTNEWDRINAKNKFKLEYDAHDQAIRQFTSRLDLMLTWYEQMGNLNKRKQDISRLRVLKQEILGVCAGIQKDGSWKKEQYANVLSWLLLFMKEYLNGEYSRLHIYSELLLTGAISVNEDGSPNIDYTMAEIRYFEPWRNALRHIVADKRNVEEVKAEILGDNIDSLDDEAGLKDNLHQLKMLGKLVESKDDDYVITEAQVREATDSADERTVHFKETLELAYTYNQINEIEKETLSGIMSRYKSDFYASMDFANWRRFLEALEHQIKEYAEGRKVGLRSKLDLRLADDPNSAILLEADRLLEEDMNLAVTEEYLNRYDAGETELDDDADLILHDNDYFEDFLNRDNFDKLLQECRRNDGRALKTFGWNYLEKNLPRDWTNRLRDDSRTMITSWPSRKDATNADQIKTLFTCLGFNVIQAFKVNGRKEEMFQIIVDPTPKSMADYRHPIASFGTQLKSPMNVIVLYGNYTEKQLVDTISSLDLGGISIVLIDRPFDAARRRLIGEIFHTQTSGQNPFLLIDQVLFMYLAMHQITERLPALLKCTLPYTTYQPFVRDGGSTTDEMFCGRTQELATIIDPNGACVVYGGRQLGKTALLERVESRCSKPENKVFAVYSSIIRIKDEEEVVATLISDIERKTAGKIQFHNCKTLKEMCSQLSSMFRSEKIVSMHLLIDEVDDFLAAIADQAYKQLQPLVDLKRETRNNIKFVIAGLHNVCRAKNATRENGIFGQLGTPLCIKPLSPTDALKLLSRPLSYLGFQIDRYPHLETILTNTNYYPGILQFFGYMLVQTLTGQYSKYYHAADGNPPFTLQDEQLGSVMNSSDLNKSIKDKFRWSLELDTRYFMIARCITMLYHYYEDDRSSGSWLGFKVEEIVEMAKMYDIKCLENETLDGYKNLLDEMEEMGILSQPEDGLYRLRRSSFVDIIGENIDVLEQEIANNNKEA